MAESLTASTRLPRGTKPVAQAFLSALDAVPEMSRSAVAKAAQAMIRDELKTRREKMRKTTTKTRQAAPARKMPVKDGAMAARKTAPTRKRRTMAVSAEA